MIWERWIEAVFVPPCPDDRESRKSECSLAPRWLFGEVKGLFAFGDCEVAPHTKHCPPGQRVREGTRALQACVFEMDDRRKQNRALVAEKGVAISEGIFLA